MAVAFDAKTAAVTSTGSAATITVSNLTVGSGSNRALLLQLWISSGTTPGSIAATWDSGGTNQAMTIIPNTTASHAVMAGTVVLLGLINPIAGNKSLVATWTGSLEAHATALSFTGVDQTSVAVAFPHGNTVNLGSTASPISVTITSATGNMVAAMFAENVSAYGAVSGTTLAKDDATGPNLAVVSSYANGAASVAMTAAFTGPSNQLAAGCDVLAAGGVAFIAKNNTFQQAVKRGAYI